MDVVNSKELYKYELPVRSWATHEPDVAKLVRKVDRFRLAFVRSLFAEMGFEGSAINATSIFQSGARSIDAMLDVLGQVHERLRAATG